MLLAPETVAIKIATVSGAAFAGGKGRPLRRLAG